METFICYFYSSHLSHSILKFNTHTRLNTKHTKMIAVGVQKQSVLNEDLSLNILKTISHSEKLIDDGCHGVAIFGSTGQAQLISVSEKIKFLNELSKSKYKEKFIIGTGLNSLIEIINFMKISSSL